MREDEYATYSDDPLVRAAEFIGSDGLRVNPPAKHVTVLGIDPGTTQSAYVLFDCCEENHDARMPWPVLGHGIVPNEAMRAVISSESYDAFAIEMIASYGMAVGAEVFQTCTEIGAFEQQCRQAKPEANRRRYTRKQIVLHHCNSPRGNDSSVRQALIDRFGGRVRAIGTKKIPGPLYGVSNDVWSALAIAVKFADDWKTPF